MQIVRLCIPSVREHFEHDAEGHHHGDEPYPRYLFQPRAYQQHPSYCPPVMQARRMKKARIPTTTNTPIVTRMLWKNEIRNGVVMRQMPLQRAAIKNANKNAAPKSSLFGSRNFNWFLPTQP